MPAEQREAETMSAILTGLGFAAWSRTKEGRPYVALHEETAREVLSALTYYSHSARPNSVRLIIRETEGLVARVDNYQGPIPRPDEYIVHPPLKDDGISDQTEQATNALSVKRVTYGIITRPQHGEPYFTGRPVQVVEVFV